MRIRRTLCGTEETSFSLRLIAERAFRYLTGTQQYKCKYLTICTGLHVTPQVPDLPGIEHVKANPNKTVIHSADYKERAQLAGRKVIILGSGETGNDIAYESIKAGAREVVLCSRGG
ncbi:MAG: NAD(P)-binding domain-containing protein [Microbacterium hominis]|nr:NAD(P)-binding domain-containing protein [Microbacterium hominis]